ncbi:hypothetical protein J6590_016611 [Homalodisca vitripennis]|nr:hypothetical protein J6590_016611 [Homalodisca vitripennis]
MAKGPKMFLNKPDRKLSALVRMGITPPSCFKTRVIFHGGTRQIGRCEIVHSVSVTLRCGAAADRPPSIQQNRSPTTARRADRPWDTAVIALTDCVNNTLEERGVSQRATLSQQPIKLYKNF